MKIRPVFFGLFAGAAGVVLLILYMRRFEQDASGGRRIQLLVAVAPIDRGKPLTADMLGTREVPQAYVDDRAIRAGDRDKILGLKATNSIPVAQTIVWTDVVAMTDDQRDLSSLVQPGNRAMPIRVTIDDEITLIHPGDFVDVIAVMNDTKDTTVLLQRVLVLATGMRTAVDRTMDKRPERATTLTLSVSLQEGQLLALAMEKARLTVAIRNPDDQRVAETPPDLAANAIGDAQRRIVPSSRRRGPQAPVRLEVEPQPR
jgi:pilus assembly protein CpaB